MKKSIITHVKNGPSAYTGRANLAPGYMYVNDNLDISFKRTIPSSAVAEATGSAGMTNELVTLEPRQNSLLWRTKTTKIQTTPAHFTHADDTGLYVVGTTISGVNVSLYSTSAGSSDWQNNTIGDIPAEAEDIFILKYGTDGELLWRTKIGGATNQKAVNVIKDDGLYIMGSISGDTSFYGTVAANGAWDDTQIAAINPSGNGLILVKYGTDGALLWRTLITATFDNYVMTMGNSSLYIAFSDSAAVAIYEKATGTNSMGATPLDTVPGTGTVNLIILKYSTSGGLVWRNTIFSVSSDTVNIATNGDTLYIMARMSGTTADIRAPLSNGMSMHNPSYSATIPNTAPSGYGELLLVAYELNGFPRWRTKIRMNGSVAKSFGASANGVYVYGDAGYTISLFATSLRTAAWSDTVVATIPVSTSPDFGWTQNDAYLIKYAMLTGILQWRTKIGGTNDNYAEPRSITIADNGGVYVSGFTVNSPRPTIDIYNVVYGYASWTDSITDLIQISGADLYLLNYTSGGSLLWKTKIGDVLAIAYPLSVNVSNYLYMVFKTIGSVRIYAPSPGDAIWDEDVVAHIQAPNEDQQNVMIIKYDLMGNLIWRTMIGNTYMPKTIHAIDVAARYNDELYVTTTLRDDIRVYAGSDSSTWNDDSVMVPITAPDDVNLAIMKFNVSTIHHTLDVPTSDTMTIYSEAPYILEPDNTIYTASKFITNRIVNLCAVKNKWVISSVY